MSTITDETDVTEAAGVAEAADSAEAEGSGDAASTSIPTTTRSSATPPSWPTTGSLLPVVGGSLQAPLVGGRTTRHVNLDYAASAPALQSVADHVSEVLPFYSSVHRGAGYASGVSTGLYESARRTIGAFVGARPDDVTVLVRNTTDALNLLARAVPRTGPGGGEVVVLNLEHHANLLPWTAGPHRLVDIAPTLEATLDRLATALRERPATLLAVTGCSNVTGECLPLERIVERAHAFGARVLVDGAQLVPHRAVDLGACGADYLAFSGHKLYAPFGAGALIGRRDWLDDAPAHLAGGGAVRAVADDGSPTWAAAPQRHEAGTPNVIGAAALAAACRAIGDLPAGARERHEQALVERLLGTLSAVPGVRVLRMWPDAGDRAGVIGFTVDGHDPGRVAAYLSAEHGIGVRDGTFCAHPLLARLGHPGGALRASVGLGSGSDDVDRLVTALRQLVTTGERASYHLVEGRWTPVGGPVPQPWWAGAGSAGRSPCRD